MKLGLEPPQTWKKGRGLRTRLSSSAGVLGHHVAIGTSIVFLSFRRHLAGKIWLRFEDLRKGTQGVWSRKGDRGEEREESK
ncbi:hypothetical protein HOP50_14g73560 [Chloropicon primus]|nr:hypothetical protein HOP50_14g73560 [Chloropicon primus]